MHPILFKIGPLTLYSYGVFVALGFITALLVAVNQAKRHSIAKESILDLGFYILLSAIIGSRLLYVIIEYKYYIKNPLTIFKIWEGGLVFFGGLIFAVASAVIYAKKKSLNFYTVADTLAPSIAVGHAIGRLGCFSAGCCYGSPTDLPWGVIFTDPHSLAIRGVPLHPTQLYESAAEFGIFVFLLSMARHKKFEGEIFGLYLILYSIVRFTIEFFRGDKVRGFVYSWLSTSQAISIVLFISAIIFIIQRRKKA